MRAARRTTGVFSGAERWRLAAAVVMLGVLGLLIARGSDRRAWRFLTPPPSDGIARPTAEMPAAAEPTDENPEEREAIAEEFQAVTDGGLRLGPEEMGAYGRLVAWVQRQSFERLWRRGKKGLAYTYLFDDAENRRGELVALEVDVRLVRDAGKTADDTRLYEAWGAADQSLGRLYDLIVVDFPEPAPLDKPIRRRARFAGYFFKLKGYHPGTAMPGQPPERAPVLIGRLEWIHEGAPLMDNTGEIVWGLAALVLVGLGIGASFLFRRKRRPSTLPRVVTSASGEAMPIEDWLERGELADDDEDE